MERCEFCLKRCKSQPDHFEKYPQCNAKRIKRLQGQLIGIIVRDNRKRDGIELAGEDLRRVLDIEKNGIP